MFTRRDAYYREIDLSVNNLVSFFQINFHFYQFQSFFDLKRINFDQPLEPALDSVRFSYSRQHPPRLAITTVYIKDTNDPIDITPIRKTDKQISR